MVMALYSYGLYSYGPRPGRTCAQTVCNDPSRDTRDVETIWLSDRHVATFAFSELTATCYRPGLGRRVRPSSKIYLRVATVRLSRKHYGRVPRQNVSLCVQTRVSIVRWRCVKAREGEYGYMWVNMRVGLCVDPSVDGARLSLKMPGS